MGLQNWWDEKVVPRIIKSACGVEAMMDIRREVVPLAHGEVFELGCGGGINQALLDPARVTGYHGIDPSAKGLDYAREAAAGRPFPARFQLAEGEALPYADASFDTVLCTMTLCSVRDPAQVLAELRRVLKPGGTYLFAEHGRAPDVRVVRMQERVDPVWKRIMGGCHTSRPVGPAIRAAGFAIDPIGQCYMKNSPKFVGWMEWGTARRLD